MRSQFAAGMVELQLMLTRIEARKAELREMIDRLDASREALQKVIDQREAQAPRDFVFPCLIGLLGGVALAGVILL